MRDAPISVCRVMSRVRPTLVPPPQLIFTPDLVGRAQKVEKTRRSNTHHAHPNPEKKADQLLSTFRGPAFSPIDRAERTVGSYRGSSFRNLPVRCHGRTPNDGSLHRHIDASVYFLLGARYGAVANRATANAKRTSGEDEVASGDDEVARCRIPSFGSR